MRSKCSRHRFLKLIFSFFISFTLLLIFLNINGCGGEKIQKTKGKTEKKGEIEKVETERKRKGFIVFERDYKLFRASEDGSNQAAITAGFDKDVAISPDGKKIAYIHYDSDPRNYTALTSVPPPCASIFIGNSNGTQKTRLTPVEWGTSSGWEPIFTKREGTVWLQRDCSQPSFSKDGSKLVFVIYDHAYQEDPAGGMGEYGFETIATIELAGKEKGKFKILVEPRDTDGGGGFSNPKFSNDNSYVYFNDFPGGGPPASAIARIPSIGGEKTVIVNYEVGTGQDRGYYAFDISPTEDKIAACEIGQIEGKGFIGKIILMKIDGSARSYIDTGNISVGADSLSFSPDGKFILFNTEEFGRAKTSPSDIYKVGVDGSGLSMIISNGRSAVWGSEYSE